MVIEYTLKNSSGAWAIFKNFATLVNISHRKISQKTAMAVTAIYI